MKAFKKFKSLIVFFLVMGFLAGALFVGKSVFLSQTRAKIEKIFRYGSLRLEAFPPALVLEDVQTISQEPFFSAKKLVVEISFMSLLQREKPLTLVADRPVLKFSNEPAGDRSEPGLAWGLPVSIEKVILRNGDIHIGRKAGYLHARDVMALFTRKNDAFSLQAESESSAFVPSQPHSSGLSGRFAFSVSGKGRELTVHKAVLDCPELVAKVMGRLQNLPHPSGELKTVFNVDIATAARFLGIPFNWEGRVEGRGKIDVRENGVAIQADIGSKTLFLDRVSLGDATGRVSVAAKAGEKAAGEVSLSIQKTHLSSEAVFIRFDKGRIEGDIHGARLDPIMSYARVPWPVRSPVWGRFVLEHRILNADAEFRDSPEPSGATGYPFRGKVLFDMNLPEKDLTFSSKELESDFGKFGVQGAIRIGRDVDVEIRGAFSDIPRTLLFAETALNDQFGVSDVRGLGNADIRITGDFKGPLVAIDLDCRPGEFERFRAASVKGNIEVQKSHVTGRLDVADPAMKGEVSLDVQGGLLSAKIRLDEGAVESILPTLGMTVPLKGPASGVFTFFKQGESRTVKGNFASPELTFLGQPLRNVTGAVDWKDGFLKLDRLDCSLFNGSLKGKLYLGTAANDFDVDLAGAGWDLHAMTPGLQGTLSLDLKGKGVFGKDRPEGSYEIRNLLVSPFQRTGSKGTWNLNYFNDKFDLEAAGGFLPGENDYWMKWSFPLSEDIISGDVKGAFNNLDLLWPWKGAKGRLSYYGEIRGRRSAPRVEGAMDLQGSVMPLPGYSQALRDYTAFARVQEGRLIIRSFLAKLGGGDVTGSGNLEIGGSGIESIDIRADGKNMQLSPLERTRALTDGWIRLVKDSRNFFLDGEFNISKLSWRRQILEGFGFSTSAQSREGSEKGFFDDMALNLRLIAPGNAWMENSSGRIPARFDLVLKGTFAAPSISGDIEATGGEITLLDRKFRLIRGRLSFYNPLTIEPFLDFQGETYIKDYRVTLMLNGLVNELKRDWSSSPPLPYEEILALMALGESFHRQYSADASTRLSAGSLLGYQLSERAQKKGEGLFSLARFRIDPFLMGSSAEIGARLTVGRQISKNFSMMYSTNLTTQREDIVRLEWEMSRTFSLVGIRNELGRVSFDVKFRKRF